MNYSYWVYELEILASYNMDCFKPNLVLVDLNGTNCADIGDVLREPTM